MSRKEGQDINILENTCVHVCLFLLTQKSYWVLWDLLPSPWVESCNLHTLYCVDWFLPWCWRGGIRVEGDSKYFALVPVCKDGTRWFLQISPPTTDLHLSYHYHQLFHRSNILVVFWTTTGGGNWRNHNSWIWKSWVWALVCSSYCSSFLTSFGTIQLSPALSQLKWCHHHGLWSIPVIALLASYSWCFPPKPLFYYITLRMSFGILFVAFRILLTLGKIYTHNRNWLYIVALTCHKSICIVNCNDGEYSSSISISQLFRVIMPSWTVRGVIPVYASILIPPLIVQVVYRFKGPENPNIMKLIYFAKDRSSIMMLIWCCN